MLRADRELGHWMLLDEVIWLTRASIAGWMVTNVGLTYCLSKKHRIRQTIFGVLVIPTEGSVADLIEVDSMAAFVLDSLAKGALSMEDILTKVGLEYHGHTVDHVGVQDFVASMVAEGVLEAIEQGDSTKDESA